MCPPPEDPNVTPDRLNRLRDELEQMTAAAASLHDLVNSTLATSETDHAVDAAARAQPVANAPDAEEETRGEPPPSSG